jgi:hypothetical protein
LGPGGREFESRRPDHIFIPDDLQTVRFGILHTRFAMFKHSVATAGLLLVPLLGGCSSATTSGDIAQQAVAAFQHAHSFHVRGGNIPTLGGTSVAIDLRMTTTGASSDVDEHVATAVGTVTFGSEVLNIVYDNGTIYIMGPAYFQDHLGPTCADQIGNNWAKKKLAVHFETLFSVISPWLAVPHLTEGSYTVGNAHTIDGVTGIRISGARQTGLVSSNGEPDLLYFSLTGTGVGTVTLYLSDYNKPVNLDIPKDAISVSCFGS